MIERKGDVPYPTYEEIAGRDPIAKTVAEGMIAEHPDWTDQQIVERINQHYDTPVIDAAEVAHWRAQVTR